LIVCPEGKGLTAYEIPSRFTTLAKHAFISCKALKKIVIPASVQNIGDEAFPRRDGWRGTGGLDVIEADPAAGGGSLGENLFDLCLWSDKPLCHPKLPLGLVKEQVGQTLLALAYCQEPEKYEGAYGEIYRKYAFSHEKTLVKKADSMKLTKVAEFFAAAGSGKKKAINYKKLSEQAKVELLEQAIVARDLAKAREVISGCGSFEFTARALGLACLYSTLDMVKLLVENGATFAYTYDSSLKRKYGAAYSTKYSQYPVSYSALIAKTDINIYNPIMFASVHSYQFGELPKITVPGNPGDVRADIAAYLVTVPSACFNAAEAMCCALRWGCTELAQRLKDLGTPLCVTAKPSLAETAASADRNEYLLCLAALPPEKCLFALKMFAELLGENQIILTQKVFETENSPFLDAEVIRFVFTHTDTSKLTKSKLVESATDRDDVSAVEALVGAGVFKNTAQRDKAIRYAMDSKKTQVLAWLMDYKNKTADLAAEAAKKEQKEMRELMEDPNSVSAMKKIWGYKKLEDGTLQITSYKGSDIHVEIPAKIGKAMVTVIGEEAFSGSEYGRWKNHMERRRIQSITIPEGVVEIGDSAFSMCESLETLVLPLSVKRVGTYAFSRCARLRDANGFVILNNTVYTYVDPTNTYDALVVPEGVTKIAPNAFKPHWSSDSCAKIQRIVLPESLVEIGDSAFEGLKQLTTVHIPAGVKVIGKRAFALTGLTSISFSEGLRHIGESAFTVTPLVQVRLPESLESIGPRAFYSCSKLRDLFISASLKTIGEELLGNYGDSSTYSWDTYHPSGVYVYTTPGSAAEEHMKQYGGVYVTYEEEQKG